MNVKFSTPIVHKKVLESDPGATSTREYVDATDYNIGDTVPFMITGTISSQIKSYDNYTYYFTDTLPKGLTLDEKSIVVQAENVTSGYAKGINATDATTLEKGDYTTTVTTNDDGSTTLKVEINDLKSLVDRPVKPVKTSDTIVVTYDAKLNGNAVIGGAGNVNKVTGEKALAGAGFTLQKKDGNTYKTVATIDPDHPTYDSSIVAKIVNGSKYEFSGLDQGEYKIVESTVPKDYHKADDVYFTITATFEGQNSADAHLETLSVGKGFTANKDSGIVSTYVNNISDKDFVLPSTGGMGRYFFLAVGALVVVAAVLP